MEATPAAARIRPILRAVTSSTRPLYSLLKCINFSSKVHIEISDSGIRFTADNSRVMQGVAAIDKSLFTSYVYNQPTVPSPGGSDTGGLEFPAFQVNLAYLLETLQILGSMDSAKRSEPVSISTFAHHGRTAQAGGGGYGSGGNNPFSDRALGLAGTCILTYEDAGSPLKVTIEESGVRTTVNLTTYIPELPDEIPFDRNDLAFKIIMQPRALADALADLSTMGPDRLAIEVRARPRPSLALYGRGGDYGSTSYDFGGRRGDLLESIVVNVGGDGDGTDAGNGGGGGADGVGNGSGEKSIQTYRFELVKAASEAMRIANKLSFRGDQQGVLNMQFMVQVDGGAESSFLDFRFVPFAGYGDDEDDEGVEEDDEISL